MSLPRKLLLIAASVLLAENSFGENRKQQAAEDWPNLGRYRAENAKLAAPAENENRVVFMGDSITDMWGRSVGKFFPGKPYVNRGIGGQTTPQMLIRFRYDVIDLKPRAVVILAGTNDLAGNTGPEPIEEIEGNLASMAELAQAHDIRVILASVTPVCDLGKQTQTDKRPPEKIVALNQWIREYCARNGDLYLDYYSAMVNDKQLLKPELTGDGLHPNAAGFAIMAPLAEQAIAVALGEPPVTATK
ncbi:MAG TPA: SGNH/GDSL hydrolase family protein [Bryobacteraceae bacterium]|jgi:lysophospholipase L1-like esterase|nr:SGNH/GDSL hydrolase family protein [Bryobacteraceae bacterium]